MRTLSSHRFPRHILQQLMDFPPQFLLGYLYGGHGFVPAI